MKKEQNEEIEALKSQVMTQKDQIENLQEKLLAEKWDLVDKIFKRGLQIIPPT